MKNHTIKTIITTFISLSLLLGLIFQPSIPFCVSSTAQAKKKTPATVYDKVKKSYGKSFKLSSKNLIKVDKKNVFGDYSKVLGVSHKLFDSYKAGKLSNSKYEYVCFICKAKSKANVKKIKKGLKKYVNSEISSNKNYYSKEGKTLMNNASIGSKDNYVYLFILDKNKNKKAVKAFKKA